MRVKLSSLLSLVLSFAVIYIIFFFYRSKVNNIRTQNLKKINELSALVDKLSEENSKVRSIISSMEAATLSPTPKQTLKDRHTQNNIVTASAIEREVIQEEKEGEIVDRTMIQTLAKQVNIVDVTTTADTINYKHVIDSKTNLPSVLIVGGTDGSGTRSVVKLLSSLGVLMVSEDPETYDIHADSASGWPTFVTPVISHAKSLDYDPVLFPDALKQSTTSSLMKIINKAAVDANKSQSFKLAVGGALPRPTDMKRVSSVKYGFKAPVAMTLVPFWSLLLPNFKFLHVVRDGRDIAFSANQGPVNKFYQFMYGTSNSNSNSNNPINRNHIRSAKNNVHATTDGRVRAIKLWSDWNVQVLNWANSHPDGADKNHDFGYFLLHIEDLVHSSDTQAKFDTIRRLANWLDADISDDTLCKSIVLSDADFMGSHDRTSINKKKDSKVVSAELSSRYGKWRKMLHNDKTLSDKIHAAGAVGLDVLGYMTATASNTGIQYRCNK